VRDYGNIVFLNGLTSSGKTSIINELVARRSNMFFVLGFDLFEETIPEWAAEIHAYYANAIIAMYCAARSFSEQGQDVIIDGLVMNISGLEEHYKTLTEIFKGYPLKMVDIHCPLDICKQRNISRGDRNENQSLKQDKIAEKNIEYELSIDTSLHTVKDCADLLLTKIPLRIV
jgi:chloramphenicol 3-O-phosphotransferase